MQLIMLENVELTKVILNFIYKHYVCHYGLIRSLIENGIVEILMLTMHTRNAKRAIRILRKIESEMSDFNTDIDWENSISEPERELFNSLDHDIQTCIKNSILCRFLPVTMLQLLFVEDDRLFIDYYKHENLQKHDVIWNQETRDTLLLALRNHFEPHILELVEFIENDFDYVKVPGNLPLYTNKFSTVVRYQCLDKEIKIGKYYARMWVINSNEIQMTNNETKAFFKKTKELVAYYGDPEFMNSNLKESIEKLTLCNKIAIELIDKFKHKDIIDVSYLDTLMEIESQNKADQGIWKLIKITFEMMRNGLKFKDMIQNYKAVIIEKLEQCLKLLALRISENHMRYTVAETMLEFINLTNNILNNFPDWFTEDYGKQKFVFHISEIYDEFYKVYLKLSELNFEVIKPIKKQSIDESQLRERSEVMVKSN